MGGSLPDPQRRISQPSVKCSPSATRLLVEGREHSKSKSKQLCKHLSYFLPIWGRLQPSLQSLIRVPSSTGESNESLRTSALNKGAEGALLVTHMDGVTMAATKEAASITVTHSTEMTMSLRRLSKLFCKRMCEVNSHQPERGKVRCKSGDN